MRDVPLWFRLIVLAVFLVAFGGLVVTDIVTGSDHQVIELALVGSLGIAAGVNELRQGGKK